jgi:hypothetical protein
MSSQYYAYGGGVSKDNDRQTGMFEPVTVGRRRVDPCFAMQVVFAAVVFMVVACLVYLAATLGTAESRFEALKRARENGE